MPELINANTFVIGQYQLVHIGPVDNLSPAIGTASGETLSVAPVEVAEYPVVHREPLWLAERALMARCLCDGVGMVSTGQIPRAT